MKMSLLAASCTLFGAVSLYAGIDKHAETLGASDNAAREPATRIVSQIQRSDYEGDRAALKRLYAELAPFVENKGLAVRIRYWRGFAMWRRATNGFNDSADPKEIEQDLKLALDEFTNAIAKEPGFVDAKV